MNMKEKIAIEICKADGINPEWPGSVDQDCTYNAWENYIPHAEAVIAAMKEPTSDMENAGYDVMMEDHCTYRKNVHYNDIYCAMIQAAEQGK